jgi:AraC-like DNA-binding protein
MPALGHAAFRRWFYQRWGRENCLIAARTRRAEYPLFEQRLSVKAAWGGTESYFVDGRRVAVDDAHYLILNDARSYASSLQGRAPVTSFALFFRPGMAAEVARCHALPADTLLADPHAQGTVEFSEHLRPHDRLVTPVLRRIYRHTELGLADEAWLEDQSYLLVGRMLATHRNDLAAAQLLPVRRASTRRELFRRIGLAVNFIHTQYDQPVGLTEIAAAAILSPYHCLRLFKTLHAVTPVEYLNRQRVRMAERLLRESRLGVDEIAARVGYGCRATLYRQIRRLRGRAPRALRAAVRERRPVPLILKVPAR